MREIATNQSRQITRLSGMLLSCHMYALRPCRGFRQNATVFTAAFVWGLASSPFSLCTGKTRIQRYVQP